MGPSKTKVWNASVDVGGKITEEGFVEFAAGKTGVQNFGVDTSGDGAETLFMEVADQFAGIAFPDGKESGHADAGEIFFAIGAQVFKENVTEGYLADALVVEEAESFFHARFVDEIDTLRRDENFVQRKADGFSLALEKFAADAVHRRAWRCGHRFP